MKTSTLKHPNFLTFFLWPLHSWLHLILHHAPSPKGWMILKPNECLVVSLLPSSHLWADHDLQSVCLCLHLSSRFYSALPILLSPVSSWDTCCVTMNPLSAASSSLLSHSLLWHVPNMDQSGHLALLLPFGLMEEHNTNMQIGATSKIWCRFSTALLGNSLNHQKSTLTNIFGGYSKYLLLSLAPKHHNYFLSLGR